MEGRLRLGVNIDHVATVRNARGTAFPDPVRAALVAEAAGADGITAHLREDRRHIGDRDIERLMEALSKPLNFEMAMTEEMQAIALRHRPHAICIVPERREERTTEGGLDVARDENRVGDFIAPAAGRGLPRVALHRRRPPADRIRRPRPRRGGRDPHRRLLRRRPRGARGGGPAEIARIREAAALPTRSASRFMRATASPTRRWGPSRPSASSWSSTSAIS
jgi:hypothetical protein